MAKKGDIDLDNINLDDFDFDIPEFQDGDPVNDKSRSPAGRVTSGIIKGAKDEIASLAGMRKALEFALPSGYGLALDTIDNVSSDVRSLYDKITGEQPDLVRGGKSFGRKAMASIGNRALPKKLADRLNSAFEQQEEYKVKSSAEYKREQEESDLAGLAEIFKAKGAVEEERAKQDEVKDLENKALDQVRFKTNIQALSSINKSMARLVGYQDKVTARYQQKMLELTYRQYATTKQLADMMSETMSKQAAVLEKIRHNTALPEAVKIRGSEMFKQLAHQRLMGSGLNTISNFTQNYGKQLLGNVSGMIQGVLDPIKDAQQNASMMEGVDRANMGGKMVGSAIGSAVRDYASIHIAPKLASNKYIARGGEKLRGAFSGLPQRINEYAQSETQGTGFGATMTQMFKQFLPKYQLDGSTGIKGVDKLDEMATFDSIARRSLIEIIPGYLSEIAHWSKVAVTGDKNAEKQVYNAVRGGFTSEKTQIKDVGRQIITRSERESLRTSSEDFLKSIGGDTMSGRAQRALKQKILEEIASGNDLKPERLVRRDQYPNVDAGVVDEIVSLIQDTFQIDEDGKSLDDSTAGNARFNDIRDQFLNMSSMIPAIGDRVRIFSDTLGLDVMRKLGYVERNKASRQDNVNFNKAWSNIFDEDDEDDAQRGSQGGPDAADKSARPGSGGDRGGKGPDDLSRRADRADRMARDRLSGNSKVGGLEKYIGDKSTLITLVRESRDFHSETVELLKQLTNCSCDGVGGKKSGMKIDVSGRYKDLLPKFESIGKKGKTKLGEISATAQDIWLQGSDHPLLEEWRLKAGEYKDKASGETLKRWEDIRSDVVDVHDEVVAKYTDLTQKAVVVNAKGKVVKKASELFSRFKASRAGTMTNEAAAYAQKKGGEISSAVTKEGRKFRPRIKRMMSFFTGDKAGADVTSELTGDHEQDMLTLAIRSTQLQWQTLKEVTQEKVRAGSYKDLWSRRKELATDAKEKIKGKYEDAKGLFAKGGALSGLAAMLGLGGKDGEEGGGGGGIMDSIGDLFGGGDANDPNSRKSKRRAGRTGKWGKIKNWGGRTLDKMGTFGKAAKFGAKATSGLGKAAWWLTKNTGKAAWWATKGVGRALGSQALRTGAAFAGRMALGALLGAAGLVSAPVLAAAAVIGGVIAVGSIIYSLSKDELPPLTRVRMVQYGVEPEADSEQIKQLLSLEKLFAQGTSVDSENKAKIDTNSIPLEKVAEIFKVDMKVPMEENEPMQRMVEFLKGRFSAVYLVHVSNYYALTKSLDLAQVDTKVTGKAALEFLSKVSMKDRSDVFEAMVGPFEDDELDMDSGDVEDVLDDAKELIEDAIAKGGDTKSASEKHADALKKGAVGGIAGATMGGIAKATTRSDRAVGAGPSGGASGGGGGAGKATTENVSNVVKASAALAGGTSAAVVVAKAAADMKNRDNTLDDGKPVRYRVYGLTEMAESKVGQLAQLENFCWPHVNYDGEGQAFLKDEALAYAEAEKIFSPIGSEAENVYVWFYRRFLPTFLTFCTEVRARGNIDAAQAAERLKPTDLLEVLRATACATDAAGISVWDIDKSPWKGYYMNDEAKSVEEPLYALSLKIKDKKLQEPTGASSGRVRGRHGEFKDEDPTQVKKPESASNSSAGATGGSGKGKEEEKGVFGNLWDGIKAGLGFGGDSKKPQSGAAAEIVNTNAAGGATGATTITGGAPVNHPGGGSGGNINDVPSPSGDGWESNSATLMAAANMVGVDPLLASSIAGVESNYRPAARPWSKKEQRFLSSAGGYFQVIDGTWKELMGKYAAKYGINPNTTQMDPRANALLGLEYIRENIDMIKGSVSRGVTDTDVYLAHFLGPYGAKRFLSAPPGDPAINHVGTDQANANKAIFYDASGRPRTVAAVWKDFDDKLKKHRKDDAPALAAAAKGAPLAVAANDSSVPADIAAVATTETPSMVKPADAVSTTSANTVAEASAPTVPENLAVKADDRQVANTTGAMAVSARVAESQSSNQVKAATDTYGGLDKGVGRLIDINESQLEQLITLVKLLGEGANPMPTVSGKATDLVASSSASAVNTNIDKPTPAKQSTVSVARA